MRLRVLQVLTARLRKTLCVLALAGLVLTAGCQRSSNNAARQGEPITLAFWNGFTGPDGTTMERIVRAFNASHPNIRVRMQIIPWATYYDKLTLGLAYGGSPDVFIVHVNRFAEYANYGAFEDINALVTEPGFPAEDFASIPWNAAVWRAKRYAIPLDCHPVGLYYNTDLFEKAGIVDGEGRARPPQDLAEFLRDAHLLTQDKNGDGKTDQWGFVYTWLRTNSYTFLHQFGTGLLTPDMKRCALDTEPAARAYRLMRDIIYKERVCPSPEGQDAWMGFQTGKVAMALEGVVHALKPGRPEEPAVRRRALPEVRRQKGGLGEHAHARMPGESPARSSKPPGRSSDTCPTTAWSGPRAARSRSEKASCTPGSSGSSGCSTSSAKSSPTLSTNPHPCPTTRLPPSPTPA